MATNLQIAPQPAPAVPAGMSYDEFLKWLDEDTRAEWVDGEVILMSAASYRHQALVNFLANLLTLFVEAHDSGDVIPGPFQMKLPVRPSGREPDLLFVSKERQELIRETYLDGAADLVVEIISIESRGRDTLDKRDEYEQSGVREYWLVDPERREFTAFQRKARRFVEQRLARGRYESAVLPGLWIEVEWLWRKRQPSLRSVLQNWSA